MAPRATHHAPGRFRRLLVPTRRQLAVALAADCIAFAIGLPLPLHLAVGAVIHAAAALWDRPWTSHPAPTMLE
jgi:hypothetical protein